MEVLPSALNLFDTRPSMLAVSESEIIEISPLNAVDNATSLDFNCLAYIDKFKDLSSINMSMTCKLLKSDLTAYKAEDTAQPYLIPNIPSSLFKACFISVQSTPINGFENHMGYKDFIECVTSYSENTIKSRFGSQMFITDASETKLKKYSANSASFQVNAKVNVGTIKKLLLPGTSLSFRFVLESPDYFIMEASTTTSVLKILDARLYIRHLTVNNDLLLSIERSLQSNKVVSYQYRRPVVVTNTVPTGITSVNLPMMWTGIKPSLLLFFMCKHSSVSGKRTENPYKLEGFNINSFSFIVDGALRPKNSYKISVEDGDKSYSHIFSRLHESLGYNTNNSDACCAITFENFKNSLFIIGEDLTRFGTSNTDVIDPLTQATIGAQLTFSKPLTEPVSLFLYMLIDTEFQIDKNRAVTLVY